jgi:hypothetical protein
VVRLGGLFAAGRRAARHQRTYSNVIIKTNPNAADASSHALNLPRDIDQHLLQIGGGAGGYGGNGST